jgi:hypothetical protein
MMSVVSWQDVVMTTIKEKWLENGLQIIFADESNRYFGDYHRTCVVVSIVYDLRNLPAVNAADEDFRDQALEAFGEKLTVVKSLERMGVPTAQVDAVRTALIENFLSHASAYLARPEYPRSFVSAELNKRRTHRYYG